MYTHSNAIIQNNSVRENHANTSVNSGRQMFFHSFKNQYMSPDGLEMGRRNILQIVQPGPQQKKKEIPKLFLSNKPLRMFRVRKEIGYC